MEYHRKVSDSLEYIEKNLDAVIRLEDLARNAHLSKYHYHRLFHKMTGESVTKYITRLRMKNAGEDLIRTDQSIIDIALKYQYSSQEAFSRAFARIYGVTPGKYRKVYGSVRSNHIIKSGPYISGITSKAA